MGLSYFEQSWLLYDMKMPIFRVFIFIFRLEPAVREQLDESNFHHYYGIFSESTILNLLDHISKFFRNNYETLWQRHLKDTLQLKILRRWINIRTNYFLSKFLETKMDESAWKIIHTIIRACSSKNIAPRHFTYYCMLPFFSNKHSS